MIKKVLFTIAFIALITLLADFSSNKIQKYDLWKSQFAVKYSLAQDSYRRIIFLRNLDLIEKHNNDQNQTYKMGINQFSALTDSQFQQIYLNSYQKQENLDEMIKINQVSGGQAQHYADYQIDWTELGQVSPIKNQGSCGSCWAFSAVAVLQSWALSKGVTVNLSEQQLVDCSHLYGNMGCNGGFNVQGLAYVRDHGITDTSSYPYVAKNQDCKIHGGAFKISHIHSAVGCNELQNAIMGRPVGVGVDATNWSRYASGIFNNCGKHLDHNVLLVGISSSFYKIKNSWGASWGEKGFIRLALGNTCGICEDFSPWVS